jgi:DNA-binding IclR family transcriptional regulator
LDHIVKPHSTKVAPQAPTGTQAVERAFSILRAFTDARREWALADLSRTLKLTKPTALRLLGVLERQGMLQRTVQGGSYRLGPTAIQLGALAQRSNDLPTAARAELEQLAAQTGETASLEVLTGPEILILDEARGRLRGSSSEQLGSRWPAHAAATGKVLLAAAREADNDAWRQFVTGTQGKLSRYTDRTITSMSRLTTELSQVAKQGYAIAIEEMAPGYVAVSAPIKDHHGQTVGAICVGGPTSRFSDKKLAPVIRQVVEAAHLISIRLGAGSNGARRNGRP